MLGRAINVCFSGCGLHGLLLVLLFSVSSLELTGQLPARYCRAGEKGDCFGVSTKCNVRNNILQWRGQGREMFFMVVGKKKGFEIIAACCVVRSRTDHLCFGWPVLACCARIRGTARQRQRRSLRRQSQSPLHRTP